MTTPVLPLLVDDTRFDAHAAGAYHPERPERLVAARAAAAGAGVAWENVPARSATDDELGRVHEPAFVESLELLRGKKAHLDADTFVGPSSIEAARLAAGGLVSLVDRMIDASASATPQTPRGLALLRPPGHHARPAKAMGFCLLNNVAIAAAHAVSRGLERVLVVDWDVHHGNGTQEMFYKDPRVLYASLHQYPFYPGTGPASDRGEGEGEGFTVNVPLGAHCADDVYRTAFERVVLPVAEAYAPELVLISAGFDAAARDPLSQMDLSSRAYEWMSRALTRVADVSAKGRIALVLEGGYDLVALESGLGRAIAGMLDVSAELPDIARAPDHGDVARAAKSAKKKWSSAVG